MPNEIIVKVKVVEDDGNKAIRARLEAQAKDLGETIAVNVNTRVTERLQKDAQADVGTGYARVGDKIGDTIGKHVSDRISEKIKIDVNGRLRDELGRFVGGGGGGNGREHVTVSDREHVTVDVNVDKQSLSQKLAALGGDVKSQVSSWFQQGTLGGFSSLFSGDILSSMIKPALITLGVVVLGPALAAALGAAVLTVLSGGAIAAGIWSAMKDPRIKGAFGSLKTQFMDVWNSFGQNFKGPLEEFIAPSNGGGGGLIGLFKQLTPMIDHLGQVLGPVAGELGNGLIGFLQNVLPAVIRGMEAGAPLIETLAKRLPGIGDAIATLFNTISAHADDANVFFNDLLRAVEFLIKALAALIGGAEDMYMFVRAVFVGLTKAVLEWVGISLRAFTKAFSWIPGLGPKLTKASGEFDKFAANLIKSLNNVPDDKYIDIHLRTIFNGVFQTVGSLTRQLKAIGAVKASGGVAGTIGTAASGGSRNGLTLVGEHGPELADLAPGSSVYSHADSIRMAGQSGHGNAGPIIINLMVDGKTIARAMADPMREFVNNNFGGSVQNAYGR